MDAIREQLNKPVVLGSVSFLGGLIIGLVVLGWWLWPVRWTDAGPEQLRAEFQEFYLRMAVDVYTLHQDPLAAQQRIREVGPAASEILEKIAANPGLQNPDSVQALREISGSAPIVQVTGTPESQQGSAGFVRTILPIMCLITFLLAGGLVAAFLLRNRIGGFKLPLPRISQAEKGPKFTDYASMEDEPPIAQFMTTYTLGNDLYDDSFSVDSQSGEFLGECGVGISESIGVGEPKRVTAFEVWLFDKNDIQTVTQVLMSRHAYSDDATRQKLAAKGEPVFAEPGREMILETATLRLLARVVDMYYGTGSLPAESFFDRMTLELTVWLKS